MARSRGPEVPHPPVVLEAEEYIIGSLMLSPSALASVPEIIGPEDFYRESHRRIYEACLALYASGSAVDAITVSAHLEHAGLLEGVGGADRIREIATLVPAASNAPHHARVMRETAIRRGLITVGESVARLGWEPEGEVPVLLGEAERLVFDLSQSHGRARGDLTHAREIARETWRVMEEMAASNRAYVGLPTGFHAIDRLTSGLRPGNLVIVAGRPSMGKTALALCIAANVALAADPTPVALFSLEMSRLETMQRLAAAEAAVDGSRVQNTRRLAPDEMRRVVNAFSRFSAAPLYIDDTGATTMTDIRSKVRRMKLREPDLGLIVVDYVQLMTAGVRADNRNAELSLISRSMKLLAVELGVPIVMLSQLSRDVEARHDKRPILSDLRDSGALEQDADVVLFVYREEYYFPEEAEVQGIAEVNIAKQRNGPTGMRKLAFRSEYAKFTDLFAEHDGPVAPAP